MYNFAEGSQLNIKKLTRFDRFDALFLFNETAQLSERTCADSLDANMVLYSMTRRLTTVTLICDKQGSSLDPILRSQATTPAL
jgi:hypothetical protein